MCGRSRGSESLGSEGTANTLLRHGGFRRDGIVFLASMWILLFRGLEGFGGFEVDDYHPVDPREWMTGLG